MSRVRILFAIPELDRGGPDRVIFEVISKIDRARFAPSVLVGKPDGHYLSRLVDTDVRVLGETRTLRSRYPVIAVRQHLQETSPDVVFATQRMIPTVGLARLTLRRRPRLIVRQANDVSADFASLRSKSLLKHRVALRAVMWTLGHADAVVCQSAAMRTDLARLLGDDARLHVIPNPVDVDAITARATTALATLRGSPRLVSVGRLSAQKGYDLLLPALPAVRAQHPGLHLTIYGDGPDRGALERQIGELGLGDTVTLAGYNSEPISSVHAADLFVLTSRYEGFPNAALEALACGTPVVLTNCPGANSEIVKTGMNGQLARDGSQAAIESALLVAIGELATYSPDAIRSDCAQRFASSHIVRRYEDLLAMVAAR